LDTELTGQVRRLVEVGGQHLGSARILLRQCLQLRLDHLAGTTPGGPEFPQYGQLAHEHLAFDVLFGDLLQLHLYPLTPTPGGAKRYERRAPRSTRACRRSRQARAEPVERCTGEPD